MADENTGLVVIDIKPEQAPTLYVAGGLDSFLEYIREMTREVPDVTTANVEHKRTINQQAVADLVAAGIPEECAVQCVKAIAKGQVSAIAITY